jgi:hypothetical protein
MNVEGVATMLPVDDVAAAAKAWEALLGVAPTFVDGDRWAQFDVGGRRIALAGADKISDKAGVMLKVGDVASARAAAVAAGLEASALQEGPHELRCVVAAPGGPVVLYAAKPKA